MKDFSLDDKLQSLDSKGLYNLVKTLMEDNSEVHRLILKWFKKNTKKFSTLTSMHLKN